MLDNFKLKAAKIELNIENELEFIGARKTNSDFGTLYHNRIKTTYEGFPIYFKYLTFNDRNEIDTKDFMEFLNSEIKKINTLKEKEFCEEHVYFIIDQGHKIFGKKYEEIEQSDPGLVWMIIEEMIEDIKIRVGDDFKSIYNEYVNECTLEMVIEKVNEVSYE